MKRYISLLAVLVLLFSSCNSWLDKKPRSETVINTQFSTENGFQDALTGVYINMASSNLLGGKASILTPELLSNSFAPISEATAGVGTSLDTYRRVQSYDYTFPAVESYFSSMWLQYYYTIANLNEFIKQIENTDVLFRGDNKQIMHGEALGLRGYLHFEVLRLWGPSPKNATEGDKGIPYVEELTFDPNVLLSQTYGETLKKIERDLLKAEELLDEVDNITIYSLSQLRRSNAVVGDDDWQWYRQIRFNYYAVLGTLTRLYDWTHQSTKAVEYADKVIDAITPSTGANTFALLTGSGMTGSESEGTPDYRMYQEALFAVANNRLKTTFDGYFSQKTSPLQLPAMKDVGTAWEKALNESDFRVPKEGAQIGSVDYWPYTSLGTNQYYGKYVSANVFDSYVPLLRLPEIYFLRILNADITESEEYFTTFARARELNLDGILESEPELFEDPDVLKARIEKEIRKDYYGEGVLFYFYKKNGVEQFTFPESIDMQLENYVVPLPKDMTDFEGIGKGKKQK